MKCKSIPPSQSSSEGFRSSQTFYVGNIRGTLGFIAALSVLVSFTYFWNFQDFTTPDSPSYIDSACNLVAGHGFSDSTGYPESLRTPGYPLLLAFFFRLGLGLKYVVIFQHLMNLVIALATTTFIFTLTGSPRQSWITGILLCLDLPTVHSANTIMTEILFTACLVVILWLLWAKCVQSQSPWFRCSAVGLLSGASVLIRPVSLLFFLPVIVYLLLARQTFRLRAVLSFVLAFMCFPLLWAGRNYQKTGYFTVSTLTGIQFLSYRAAGTLAVNDPGDFYSNYEKRRAQLEIQACDDLKKLQGKNCDDLSIPQKSEYYSNFGRKLILQHPLSYAKLALRGSTTIMLGGDAVRLAQIVGVTPAVAARILLAYTIPLFCFAWLGLFRWWRENRRLFYLSSLVLSYFVAISAGGEAYSRFRVPIMPLYAMCAAAGADYTLKRFGNDCRPVGAF